MRYFKTILLLSLFCFLMMGLSTKNTHPREGIQPGNLAPEFHRQDISLKGNKYTLLQFWASYDARSRMLNAQMHNVISQLGTEDICMVSVSMDENEAVYEGIVKAEHLKPATQFNDSQGKKSEIFKAYRLKSGFTNWLIDSKGVIVAKDLNPKEISVYFGLQKPKK